MRLTYLIWLLLCSVGPCVAADDGNLLANPGFEVAGSDALPQGWARQCYGTSQAYRDTSTVRTGEAGGRIVREPNDGGNVVALLIPRVPVRGGERYTLSGWGKGNVPAGQAKLFVYEYNEAGAWLGNSLQASVPAATDEWTPLIATETVSPECAWVQVRFEIYGGSSHGEASVDDVYLGDESSAPQAVRDLTAERQRDTAVLRWLPPDGAGISGYHVYATLDESFSPARAERVAFTTETEAEVPIPPGYGTYFAVVAVNQVGNSSRPEMAGPL
ncbi:MAG TPA: fibronectin type III domain-containing protein, partial [Armatimonadota bacterium]|nr:fibronectin type III domain-containing protein [Armatimonadota bacterium]